MMQGLRWSVGVLVVLGVAVAACQPVDAPSQQTILDPLDPGVTGRGSPVGTPFDYTGSSVTPASPPLPSNTPSGAPNQPSGSQ